MFSWLEKLHNFSIKFFLETTWLDILFCTNSSCSLLLSAYCLTILLVAGCKVRPFLLIFSYLMEIHNSLLFCSPLALVLWHLCTGTSPPGTLDRLMTGWKSCSTLQCKPSVVSGLHLFFLYFFFYFVKKIYFSMEWLYSHLAHFNVEALYSFTACSEKKKKHTSPRNMIRMFNHTKDFDINICKRPEPENWKRTGYKRKALTLKLCFNKIKLRLNTVLECWGAVINGGLSSVSPAGKGNKFFLMLFIKVLILTFCLWRGNL